MFETPTSYKLLTNYTTFRAFLVLSQPNWLTSMVKSNQMTTSLHQAKSIKLTCQEWLLKAVFDSSSRELLPCSAAIWRTRKPNTWLSLFLLARVQNQQFAPGDVNRPGILSEPHVHALCKVSKHQAALVNSKLLSGGTKTTSALWLIMAALKVLKKMHSVCFTGLQSCVCVRGAERWGAACVHKQSGTWWKD